MKKRLCAILLILFFQGFAFAQIGTIRDAIDKNKAKKSIKMQSEYISYLVYEGDSIAIKRVPESKIKSDAKSQIVVNQKRLDELKNSFENNSLDISSSKTIVISSQIKSINDWDKNWDIEPYLKELDFYRTQVKIREQKDEEAKLKAIEERKKNEQVGLLSDATNLYKERDYTNAIEKFKFYKLKYREVDNQTSYLMAICYLNTGEAHRAIEYFDDLEKQDFANDSIYFLRGMTYSNLGNYKKAISDLDKFLRTNPNSTASKEIKSYCQAEQKKYEDKIMEYNKSVYKNVQPDSKPSKSTSDCGPSGVTLYRGPKGGCYYISGNTKVYVDRSCCD